MRAINYIQCPTYLFPNLHENKITIFLAGGITNCPDWQTEVVNHHRLTCAYDLTIINPRRINFTSDITTSEQVLWEHRHLELSDVIVFWFPKETLCPITLFELGKMLKTDKKIVIGIHPEYQRKEDIIVQTGLIRPDVPITFSLDNVVDLMLKIRK